MMTKNRISRRLLKVAANKPQRLELEKAMKALTALKNQPAKARLVRAVVSTDTVVVKVQEKDSELRGVVHAVRKVRSGGAGFVDQSIKDTERAIRTLQRSPSDKVKEYYERLAAQN
ncbi:hypothetical protein [Ralstonia pseudosolanacearum]